MCASASRRALHAATRGDGTRATRCQVHSLGIKCIAKHLLSHTSCSVVWLARVRRLPIVASDGKRRQQVVHLQPLCDRGVPALVSTNISRNFSEVHSGLLRHVEGREIVRNLCQTPLGTEARTGAPRSCSFRIILG